MNRASLIGLILGVVLAVPVVMGFRYYRYVTNTESPYDEMGGSLNEYMPEPIRSWGCARLKATFGNRPVAAPGCNVPGKPGWR